MQATVFPQRISRPPPIFPASTPQQAVTKQSSHPWSRKLFPFVLKKKQLPQINAGHTVIFEKTLRQHHTPLKIQGRNFILNFHSAAVTLHPYYNITATRKKHKKRSNLMWGHFTRHIFVTHVLLILLKVFALMSCVPLIYPGLHASTPFLPTPICPYYSPSPQHPPN